MKPDNPEVGPVLAQMARESLKNLDDQRWLSDISLRLRSERYNQTKEMMMRAGYLTITEICIITGLTYSQVRHNTTKGRIPCKQVGKAYFYEQEKALPAIEDVKRNIVRGRLPGEGGDRWKK